MVEGGFPSRLSGCFPDDQTGALSLPEGSLSEPCQLVHGFMIMGRSSCGQPLKGLGVIRRLTGKPLVALL